MDKNKKEKRFDGLSVEEVQRKKNSLPDYLEDNMDLVFLGINPSLMAAHKGRYYAGPGNHFYKLLHAAELVPRFVNFEEDENLIKYKIGLTNIVERPTRSSADLTTAEIKKGCDIVVEKMKKFKPKIAIFNGKCIYEVFAQYHGKSDFHFGLQQKKIGNTALWVVPSSSARCSNFPRMEDKLHFYLALRKYLMFLKGEIENVNLHEFIFENKSKKASKSSTVRSTKVPAFLKNTKIQQNKQSDDNNCNNQFVITEILGKSSNNKPKDNQITSNVPENEVISSEDLSPAHSNQDNYKDEEIDTVELPENPKKEESTNLISKIALTHGNLDFMNLIKRRLSEKKDKINSNTEISPVKKLKSKKN